MSNPTFVQGPIGFDAAVALDKFTLVAVNEDGAVEPATAAGPVFGVVTESADPNVTTKPTRIAVHYGVAAVKLRVAGGDASAIAAGAPVFAAADGLAAGTGTVQVGVAVRQGAGDKVLTILNGLPAAGSSSEG